MMKGMHLTSSLIGPVFVSFIDDRSAFVALHRRDQAKVVLKTMTGSNIYKLMTFAAYQKQFERFVIA